MNMSDILTADNIPALVALTVPGIIILYVHSRFYSDMPLASERLIAYVAVTLAYYAGVMLVFSIIGLSTQYTVECLWHKAMQFGWFNSIIVLVVPALLGLLLGLAALNEWSKGLLKYVSKHVGVELSDLPPPNAWDLLFSRFSGESEGLSVVVTLKNGRKLYGRLGDESITSTDTKERDIYIEKVYTSENGVWQESKKTRGVWIAHGEIQTMEFLSND